MININSTNARAMGNSYLCKFEVFGECVILANNGEIGIRRALRQKGMYPITIRYIHNIEADRLQKQGVPFFEIEEV